MSDFMSINGQGYMKVPCNLIVEVIFSEMSKRHTFVHPGRMDLFAKALNRAIDNAARFGYGCERVLDKWYVVVMDGTISVFGTVSSLIHIGQFNVATNVVKHFAPFDLVSTEAYSQLKAALPELIRREIKSLNNKVINALFEAVVRVHFQMFETFGERVYFDNSDSWVEFWAENSENGEPGIGVWYGGKASGDKFIPFAGLTD